MLVIPPNVEKMDGVKTIFVLLLTDEWERLAQFQYWMEMWLRKNLGNGIIRLSLEPGVVENGLGGINAGLGVLLQGVSCTMLVAEVGSPPKTFHFIFNILLSGLGINILKGKK